MNVPALFKEEPAKLILNRRAIAAGLAALVAAPIGARQALAQIADIPLTFDPASFAGAMRDGLFLPDYRHPMCRIVFADGHTTEWNRYTHVGKKSHSGNTDRWINPKAIEVCCPDKNGMPRYAQLAIG